MDYLTEISGAAFDISLVEEKLCLKEISEDTAISMFWERTAHILAVLMVWRGSKKLSQEA
jgi:hypothetical protein